MSRLRHADYSEQLRGKTIERVRWFSDHDERHHCLSIVTTDQKMITFCFKMTINEEAEIADFIEGNLSNDKLIQPTPVKPKPKL